VVDITAAYGGVSALTITPDTVFGGEAAVGTVALVAAVPASVTVPAGATSAQFTITTRPVSGQGTLSWINGNAGGQDRGAA
jgi:hypothetical protein